MMPQFEQWHVAKPRQGIICIARADDNIGGVMRQEINKPGNGNKGSARTGRPPGIHLPNGRQVLASHHEAKIVDQWPSAVKAMAKKPVEIATRDFPDGTRVRLICDPKNQTRTMFAAWRAGHVDYVDKLAYKGEAFVPPRADDRLFESIALPRGVQPHDAPSAMARSIGGLVDEVVALSPQQQVLLGAFGVVTRVSEGLPFAPTVAFCGPRDITLPLLQALRLLCPYALLIGDVTPGGLLEACSRIKPTPLIADYGLRQHTLRLLEMGSRPGIFSLQKGGACSPCCPRAIACSDASVPRDLLSGSVIIPLPSLDWANVGLLSDSGFLERAACLQQQLLGYELECNGIIRPLQGDRPSGMRPREWDAFRCWGAPFAGDEEYLRELLEAMRCAGELSPNGLLVGPHAVLSGLDFLVHEPENQAPVSAIAAHANKILEQSGEELRLKERKVGAILTQLGFPRWQRGGDDGPYQLQFYVSVKRLIHRLVKYYGAWQVELYSSHARVTCPLCREYKLVSEGDLRWYERELKPAEERQKREEQAKLEKRMEQLRRNPPQVLINKPAYGKAAKS
jgi:hypothetical protein